MEYGPRLLAKPLLTAQSVSCLRYYKSETSSQPPIRPPSPIPKPSLIQTPDLFLAIGVRERKMQVRGGGSSGEVAEGFWIRRSASPVAARAGSWRPHSFICADGKENVSCCGGRRRSPLPAWYPRTPLRDITTIIDVLERRRIRMQAVRAQQRNLHISASPGPSHLTMPQEQSVSAQPPLYQVVSSDISEATPNTAVPAPTTPSPVMHQPQASSTSPSSQAENSDHISSGPTDVEQPEPNIKLRSLINEIEKMVIENMMRSPEEPLKRTKQRSTLMSMR